MDPNQASASPPCTTTRPNYNDATAATQSVVKQEDDYNDDDGVYRSRPQLQVPTTLMRNLAELMSK